MSLHLARMRIDGFGPLRGFEISFDRLTVIVGSNESGKSSIVDALHAWLRQGFRRTNALSWDGVRRNVPGYDGTVEVELTAGSAAGPPVILCEQPLLWNLLVVPEGRAGLRRVGSGQEDWLVEARPHLTGFDAETLRSRVRERAGLTPKDRDTKEWADESGRLAGRREGLESFLAGLASLGEHEAELRARRADLARGEATAARQRAAADFETWRRAASALAALAVARTELANLERYGEDDLRRWRGLEVDLAHQAARQHSTRRGRNRAAEDRDATDEAVQRAELAVGESERRIATIDASGLAGRLAEAQRGGAPGGGGSPWLGWLGAAGLVAGVALLAAGGARGWLAGAGATLAIVGAMIVLVARRAARHPHATLSSADMLAEARRLGLEAQDLPAIARAIEQAHQVALGARVRLEAARAEATRAAARVEELARETMAAEREFSAVEERIRTVRERAGVPTIDALAAATERRRRAEIERARAEDELRSLLPGRSPSEWEREVEAHRAEDPGAARTPGGLARLEAELAEMREIVARLERETAGTIEKGLLGIGEPDLSSARSALEQIHRTQEERERLREATRLALAIVDEADRDVEGHLDRALADPVLGAGATFSRLTAGRWSGLRRNGVSIEAVAPDGSTVRPEALSRGTHDQLHVALRAALARRVLGEPAFFVWDDTFLTADPERRRALVTAAIDLVRCGWQLVYLTVDPSIADLFAREAGAAPGIGYRIVPLPDRSAT